MCIRDRIWSAQFNTVLFCQGGPRANFPPNSMTTTTTDQITDMTYDEAKDYLLNLGQRGLGLCYQRFPKPPSWSQSLTHYDRLAANLRSGAALGDSLDDRRDAHVLENLFGRKIKWIDNRQGKLGTWGDERVQLFENPVLTSAFKTLTKMWRAYWLLIEEIRCHENATNIEIDPPGSSYSLGSCPIHSVLRVRRRAKCPPEAL